MSCVVYMHGWSNCRPDIKDAIMAYSLLRGFPLEMEIGYAVVTQVVLKKFSLSSKDFSTVSHSGLLMLVYIWAYSC